MTFTRRRDSPKPRSNQVSCAHPGPVRPSVVQVGDQQLETVEQTGDRARVGPIPCGQAAVGLASEVPVAFVKCFMARHNRQHAHRVVTPIDPAQRVGIP